MASFGIASFFVVLLVASCVLNSEAGKCATKQDCTSECPQGGFCDVASGQCVCLPATECAKDSDCVNACAGYKIHKCQGGLCVCQ
ncbi:hypothetical protein HRI_004628400 [Hibiscus trionum]|uniref:Uncharacterized protein n=1 Tax=Hibiscus trionum TaxID=183268 RepID=A0A9W7J7F5_HIBTR|nr:hypothetical protein HRI_004628400 [Hibiscus trionum]